MKQTIFTLLLFISTLTAFSQEQKVSLLFVGDAMQHKAQLEGAKTKTGYDYSSYFKLIKDSIQQVDLAVVNLETTLPGKGYTGYPCFGSPDEFAFELKDAGFDVFLTANNHCLDKHKKGLERTIQMLDSMEVRYTGTFLDEAQKDLKYPLIITQNGIRMAFLNYTYGTNGINVQAPNIVNYIDKKAIFEDIEKAKLMKPDIIIANMHWGDEYKLMHNKTQKDLAKFLIDNGVRLVIGAHPHVVQPLDIKQTNDSIENVVIYSMGNFVSNMRAINTDGGMMVNINLSKKEDNSISIDTCYYSLIYVHKPFVDGKQQFQVIPVNEYENEEGKAFLGDAIYNKMSVFARNARKAIETNWIREEDKE